MAAHLNAHKPATASRWVVAPTRLANETAIHFHAHAADAHHLKRALDAGAGPLSSLGTHCGGVRVELFPIDVLAPSYDGVLDQVKLTPRTRTRFCPVEQIDRCFAWKRLFS